MGKAKQSKNRKITISKAKNSKEKSCMKLFHFMTAPLVVINTFIIMDFVGSYHEPPPPPPDPPPDIPPPDDEEELLDGLEVITLLAESIVEFINV